MNYTSIEQSKKLLELGLNPKTADMEWVNRPSRVTDCPDVPVIMDIELESMLPKNKLIPCWSVGALLEVIPKNYRFNTAIRIVEGKYITWAFECQAISEYEFKGSSDLECLYNAVVMFLENDHIKKDE